jgi:serine/threonine protein kinase
VVLVELVHADLECRLRAGEPARVEDYLQRYSDLNDDLATILDLIVAEHARRRRREPDLNVAEYLGRFPHFAEELRRRLPVSPGPTGETPTHPAPPPGEPAGPAPLVPGYEVLRELGRGGMGIVYLARHVPLNRVVALKMILHGGHAGAEERGRFVAEAEAIAAVKHPGIVQVFDFGTHDGLPYFSLEYCEGGSLAGKLAEGPLPPAEAARLVEQVARAVQAAHERGIVHRDLKPGNVLLSAACGLAGQPEPGPAKPQAARQALAELVPKITDFGLAKRLEAGPGLTATGAVMGTPSYLAPEQALGSRLVGPAVDLYALGAILYECLTGRPPFKAATVPDTLLQVVADDPVPPRRLNPAVPRDLETICLKCLNKQPRHRYASAQALADDLSRWMAGEPISIRPAGPIERAAKWLRRRPAAAALLGVSVLAVLGLAVLGVVAVWQWQSAAQALKGKQRAQVEALLAAHPRAVPAILADLAEEREQVRGRLLEVWQEPDTPENRPRRMRAALALLPGEPALRDALVSWMLEVPDPEELLLVRAALRPHAEELRGGLWQRLEDPETAPEQRLRILAALALFDPKGPGWATAGESVLETWLSADPLSLGVWTEALRPARDRLLGPLTKVFQGKRLAERRLVAAGILADYAADQPETLARLSIQADDRQLAALLPALRRQRSRIIPLLHAELRRPAPAGAGAPAPSVPARPRRQIEQAGGLLTARFALVQTLPLEQGEGLVQVLAAAGYQPSCYRPYRHRGRLRLAAVWTRGGPPAVLQQGLSAEALRRRDAELVKSGHAALDVSVYSASPAGPDRYAALWARRGPDTRDTRLVVGVTPAELAKRTAALTKDGFVPRTQTWTAPDGKAARCGAIWWKPARPIKGSEFRIDGDVEWYERMLVNDLLQSDVRLVAADPLGPPRHRAREQYQSAQLALERAPDDLARRHERAEAAFWLGKDQEALADLDLLIRRKHALAADYAFRAVLHARAGRAEAARADLGLFLKQPGRPAEQAATRALVGLHLGDGRAALRQLEASLAERPNDPDALHAAARVYAQAEGLRQRQGRLPSIPDHCADRAVELLGRARLAARVAPIEVRLDDIDLEPVLRDPLRRRQLRLDRRFGGVWQPAGERISEQVHGLAQQST